MKLYSADGAVLLEISSIERDGRQLVMKGKAYGAMPMSARLRPQEARAGLRLLGIRKALFLVTLLFRRRF